MAAARPWRTWFRLALVVAALGAAVAPTRARASYAEVGACSSRAAAERRLDVVAHAAADGQAHRIAALCAHGYAGWAQLGRRLGFERRVDHARFGGSACGRERLQLAVPVASLTFVVGTTDERVQPRRHLYLEQLALLL
jgi:hypothetical protein